jgi:ABC-type amino acid transport substrate-binding protein
MTRLRLAVAALAVTALAAAPTAGATTSKTYTTFKPGPQGGDAWSYHSAGTDGSVTVFRAYPIVGLIGCGAGAPYAKLLVTHRAAHQLRTVTVTYTNALVDPYTFLSIGVHDAKGRWYGVRKVRGPLGGDGTATLKVDRQVGRFPQSLVVEIGLEMSGACPSADGGRLQFTQVKVTE